VNGEPASRGLRWPLRIKVVAGDSADGVVTLVLAGRLGEASANQLSAALDAAIESRPRGLILDLEQVDYLSSAGLRALDLAGQRLAASGGVLVLCALSEPLRIAFELAGFLTRYPVEPSRELASARLSGAG
jgi:anti-anti-sigma factor